MSTSATTPTKTSSTRCSPRTSKDTAMTDTASNLPKPKKSVALSGTAAGNTALCTVGRSGNDLHYRGYDIHDLATQSTFEEVSHLLVHGALPTQAQLDAYRTKLRRLRGLPAIVAEALELVPANAHPMDVLRRDRKSTRLNSSHSQISYAVFCLKKKKKKNKTK